jgi:hypothetical protein
MWALHALNRPFRERHERWRRLQVSPHARQPISDHHGCIDYLDRSRIQVRSQNSGSAAIQSSAGTLQRGWIAKTTDMLEYRAPNNSASAISAADELIRHTSLGLLMDSSAKQGCGQLIRAQNTAMSVSRLS